MATTAPANQRFLELDALRGFAVMGILAMNIVAFAMPSMAYMSPQIYGGNEPTDLAAWLFSFIFFDGKMRGLFSLLFGASMMLIITRAQDKDEGAGKVHYTRMFWLGLFGLFHFFFIWWGDILFLYAMAGCIAFLFHRWEARRLIKWALIIYIAATLLWSLAMGSMFMLQAQANAPGASPAEIEAYKTMLDDMGFTAAKVQEELAAYGGGFFGIFQYKVDNYLFQPLFLLIQVMPETLPLMMIGMAMLKNGFILGDFPRTSYVKWAIWGIAIGAALFAFIGWILIRAGFDPLMVMNAAIAWTYPPRLLMTIGYLAALILLIQRFAGSALMRRVAAAGRAAFTNYLGTSIVMTFIFYGWGLGLYGSVGRWELYLFVIGMWALMLLWSKPWLENFRYGPLEWLWRSLARGSLQPMRMEAKS